MIDELFHYPCLYHGPKDEKGIQVPGRFDLLYFRHGPDHEKPYAYVTELEGRYLSKRFKDMFSFPQGLRQKGDDERLIALEARVLALEAATEKRARKAVSD